MNMLTKKWLVMAIMIMVTHMDMIIRTKERLAMAIMIMGTHMGTIIRRVILTAESTM